MLTSFRNEMEWEEKGEVFVPGEGVEGREKKETEKLQNMRPYVETPYE